MHLYLCFFFNVFKLDDRKADKRSRLKLLWQFFIYLSKYFISSIFFHANKTIFESDCVLEIVYIAHYKSMILHHC